MPLLIFKAPYKHLCLQYANPCLIKGQTGIQMFSTIFLRPSQRSTSEIKLAHGRSWLRPKIRPLCFLYRNGQEILFLERCFCYVSFFYFKATMLEFWQRVCFAGDTFPCTRQEHSGMYGVWMTKSVLLLLMHPMLHVTQCGDWLSLFGVTINTE